MCFFSGGPYPPPWYKVWVPKSLVKKVLIMNKEKQSKKNCFSLFKWEKENGFPLIKNNGVHLF